MDKMNNVDITPFIRELLFGHDCVIVPGFGGFIGNYASARIDSETGTFYPPEKKISFNRNLNHNDGLLIKQISAALKVNYGDAREIVAGYIADTKKKLDKGENATFDRIGTFTVNQEGNLEFEPDRSINYHLDSWTLEPFQYSSPESYDVRKRISGHAMKEPVKTGTLRKYLWRAAVIIPVATLILAVSLKSGLFKPGIETSSMNPLVSAEFENNKQEIDNEAVAEKPSYSEALAVNIADSSAALIPSQPVSAVPVTPVPMAEMSGAYYIITGSFQSEVNAKKQADLLQAEGFNPEVVLAGNGFYRVCAMACPDLSTAVSKKDSILDKFPGAWVSRKK
jgi:hypothetical protein